MVGRFNNYSPKNKILLLLLTVQIILFSSLEKISRERFCRIFKHLKYFVGFFKRLSFFKTFFKSARQSRSFLVGLPVLKVREIIKEIPKRYPNFWPKLSLEGIILSPRHGRSYEEHPPSLQQPILWHCLEWGDYVNRVWTAYELNVWSGARGAQPPKGYNYLKKRKPDRELQH